MTRDFVAELHTIRQAEFEAQRLDMLCRAAAREALAVWHAKRQLLETEETEQTV